MRFSISAEKSAAFRPLRRLDRGNATAAANGRIARVEVLIIGNSIRDGVGTALLIPPVYVLTTCFPLIRPPERGHSVSSPGWAASEWQQVR